ncbi:MAG: hypothetical protein EBS01_10560, partial [Verrucomicrobia bacterium]|nr:hypothetical protein [Verrucomicrobiota bacterium]
LFSILLLTVLPPSLSAQTGGFGALLPGPPKALPSLVADTTAVAPAQPFFIGIRFKLADGWHLYWRFPGDSGAAPQVEWTLPPGFEAGAIQWPLPHSLKSEGDIYTNVYEGELLLPVEIRPPATLPKSPLVFKARLKWYVCAETCLPGEDEVTLTLTPGTPTAANAELFKLWKNRLPQPTPPPFSVDWNRAAEGLLVKIEGVPSGQKVEIFPMPPAGATAEHPEIVSRTFRIPAPGAASDSNGWKALVVLEEPSGERHGWEVDSKTSAPASPPQEKLIAPPDASTPRQIAPPETTPREAGGLAGVLWAAFLGGLLLNLMPCVLPVIALKILGFTQQAGAEPKRVFRLGLAFCAGVFAFFLGLALAVLGLKAAGSGLNWGFQFQNPWILTALIAAVFVFGLNLLGVFEITLGSEASSKLNELSNKQGLGGAFLHGAFTTLLGTSCTAPYLGVTLGFAVSQPAMSVFAIFFTIAAGMSLPYLALTSNPALLRFLPKPGAWMERLKQIMGFVILGVAVWLLGVLGQARGSEALAGMCFFLLIAGAGCWFVGIFRARPASLIIALALTGGAYRWLVFDTLRKPAELKSALKNDAWVPFSPERLAAERAAGHAVFVDFTAEWCLNCKVNERVTLSKQEVKEAFEARHVVLMKADWTNGDPVITAELNRFGRVGVPFYLLYTPDSADALVFPELLTPGIVLDALEKIPVP